jgi:phosphopantetheine adenylyltransferase
MYLHIVLSANSVGASITPFEDRLANCRRSIASSTQPETILHINGRVGTTMQVGI